MKIPGPMRLRIVASDADLREFRLPPAACGLRVFPV